MKLKPNILRVSLFITLLLSAFQSFSQINYRYSTNTKGDIIYVSNSIISCGTGSGNCTKSDVNYLYSGPDNATLNNNTGNNYTSSSLTFFDDIDGNSTTFNSSSSTFALPSGVECPEIVWAGLYWGAECNAASTITGVPAAYTSTLTYANRTKVLFKVPGSSIYQNLTADANYSAGTTYHCFKDVTSIVKAAGTGVYTCANIVSKTNADQKDGGWTIVIIYSDQAGIKRNLSVFDGLTEISSANRSVQLNINGFSTPASGAIGVRCGIVVYDGDRSSISDSLQFRGAGGTNFPNFVKLTDAVHPLNNAFNSTIANYGVPVTTRNPAWTNTLGYDASLFTVPNTANSNLGNAATSATLKLTTGSESYRVGVVTTMIDIVDPELVLRKSVSDINGGLTVPGDTLEYTLRIVNKGNDTALNCLIYDSIPFNGTFVANSLKINNITKTDGLADDQAEYSAATNKVVFRVGNGASATLPGKLRINDSVTVKFRIKITNDCAILSCGSKIYNRGFADYTGNSSNASFTSGSKPDLGSSCSTGSDYVITDITVSCIPPPDVSILITCPTNFIKLNQVILLDNAGVNVTPLYTQFFTDAALTNPISNTANITEPGVYYAVRPFPSSNPFCVGDVIKITVTQQPLFTDASFTQTNVSCNGQTNGAASVTTIGGTPTFSYLWSNGQTASSITNLPAGTYTVTVTDINSCFIRDTVIISEPMPLLVSAVSTPIFCPNSLSTITVTAGGGILPYQFKLNNGAFQASNIFSAGAGNYLISVKDSNNCITTIPYSFINTDNIPPAITCPGNVNSYATSNSCTAIINNISATVTDNCKVNRVIYTATGATTFASPTTGINDISGNTFNTGVTTVTYTAYDTVNNSASCSFTVTILDTVKPVLNCPSNQSVNTGTGVCTATLPSISSDATDNCSLSKVIYAVSGATTVNSAATGINNASAVIFNKGISTVNYTATDINGNTSGCSFKVTVTDNERPVINCPANVTLATNSGSCNRIANNIAPLSATDNCGVPVVNFTVSGATTASGSADASGISFNTGVSTIKYFVTDASGNKDSCVFTVTIADSTKPAITCPAAQQLILNASCAATVPAYTATVSDNCSVASAISISQVPAAGSIVNGMGNFTVSLTATDAAGNSNSCSFQVTKTDNTPPQINCMPAQVLALDASCNGVIPDYRPLLTITENCTPAGAITILQTPAPGTAINGTGTLSVKFVVTDASGNTDSCTAIVNKTDTIRPVIICPGNQQIYLGSSCTASLPNYATLVSATDNCTSSGAIVITQNPAPGSIINNAGITTVTITATDASGNAANCSFSVNSFDTIKPSLICPAHISINTDPGTCFATNVTLINPTIKDNCGTVSLSNDAPASFPVGTTTVIWTASDANGNSTTCTQIIIVTDVENPAVTCPADVTINTATGLCTAIVSNINVAATDNCGVNQISYIVSGATNASSILTGLQDASGVVFNKGNSTVTYKVTDIHGNVSTCSFTVHVVDNEKPAFTCPSDISVAANSSCKAVVNQIGLNNITDNCGITTTTFSVTGSTTTSGNTDASGTTFNAGISTVTYTVTDVSGNSSTCSFTVTVMDSTKPVLSCLPDQTINLTGACSATLPDYTVQVSATDNCTASGAITITQIPAAGTPLTGTGILTVSLIATDESGNSDSCIFAVNKVNNNTPQLNCMGAQILYLAVNCSAVLPDYRNLISSSDICAGNAGVTIVQIPAPGTIVSNTGTMQIKFIVTDLSNNSDSCTSILIKTDTVKPIINCPSPQQLYLNNSCASTVPDYTSMATANDACTPSGDIIFTQSPVSGTALTGAGNFTVTLTATDASGNTQSCSFEVEKTDTVKPVLTCPSDVLVNNDANLCSVASINLGIPNATDVCGIVSITNNAPAVFPVGITEVIYTATDANGNINTCTQIITVRDIQLPVITCPANVTVNAAAGLCSASNVLLGTPVTDDNCGIDTIYNDAPSIFPVGSTTVTWYIQDIHGNRDSCIQIVKVTDTEQPSIVCPGNIAANSENGLCSASGIVINLPVTNDNCGIDTIFNDAPLSFPVGITTITHTVIDIHGNTKTCAQIVEITDTELPEISCPVGINTSADANSCMATNVQLGTPAIHDNCGIDTMFNDAPSVYPVGTTVVTYTVKDIHGNIAQCTQQVTVTDNEKPAISCPGTINLTADPGSCFAGNILPGTPTVSDNCGVDTVFNDAPLSFPVGTTIVTHTVVDIHGNTNSCTQEIIVTDNELPVITCAGAVSQFADAGLCTASSIVLVNPVFNDNCGIDTIFNNAPVVYPVGTTDVTWTVVDLHGNNASCTQQVTVTDNEKPAFVCLPAVTSSADPSACFASNVNLGNPVASDNCGVDTIVNDAPTVFPVGTTIVTWIVTDIHGNTDTCKQTVTITDAEKPVINCPASVDVTADPGNCYATNIILGLPVTSDNCGIDTVYNNAPLSIPVGTTNVTWTVADIHGNIATCTQSVTVRDAEIPQITCMPAIFANADPGACIATAITLDLPITNDNCGIANIQNDAPASYPVGTTTVTYTVTDIHGNTNSCTREVTVTDIETPAIVCATDLIIEADPGTCTVSGLLLTAPAISDNCGIDTITNDAPVIYPVGTTIVTWTVKDIHGNISTCTQHVTVKDNELPVMTCPTNKFINNTTGLCTGTANNLNLTATDNCGLESITYNISGATNISSGNTGLNDASTVIFNKGESIVEYVVKDIHGNISTCSFSVQVLDVQKPTFSCPADITIKAGANCDVAVNNIGLNNITDNCGNVFVNWNITGSTNVTGTNDASGIIFNKGLSTVQYIVNDLSANADTCSFTVNVIDSTSPSIICTPDQTLYLSGSCLGTLPDYTLITSASDNCNTLGSGLTITQQPAPNTPVTGLGLQTIQLIATDEAGNSDTCSFSINKINANPPVMNCIGAQNLYLAVNCSAVLPDYTSLISSTDICLGNSGISTIQVPPAGTVVYGTGSETIKFIATDTSGNMDSCTVTIYKIDTLAPSINCPNTQELYLGSGCNAIIPDYKNLAVPYDACTPISMITIIQTPAPGTVIQNTGLISITLTAIDSSGNSASCSFNVVKIDTIAPAIVCPAAITANNNPGQCYASGITLGSALVLDGCTINSITNNAPINYPVGNTTVVYTVSDANGNISTCEQQVTVLDNELPTILCPVDITDTADAGNCGKSNLSLGIPVTNDNCGIDTVYNNAPLIFPVGVTTVNWTVVDIHGNIDSCQQNITILDKEIPTITCPAPVNTIADSGSCAATNVVLNTPVTNDNCGVDTLYNDAPASFPVGTTTVTWTIKDIHGNTATCTQDVVVADTEIPTITCPAPVNTTADSGSCAATNVVLNTPVTNDNCGVDTLYNDAPASFPVGTTTVTWTVKDIHGNVATCTQDVIIADVELPTITCPAPVNAIADSGSCAAINVVLNTPVTNDNCGIDTLYNDAPASFPVGITTVTWTVKDIHGNSATCTQEVVVADMEKPTISCAAAVFATADSNKCGASNINLTTPLVSDNCGIDTLYNNAPVVFPTGSTTVTWIVRDIHGNTDSCTQEVTIQDNIIPVITQCAADTVIHLSGTPCQANNVMLTAPVATDNCGIASVNNDHPGLSYASGVTMVNWTITDHNSNSATCSQKVTVICSSDITVKPICSTCPVVICTTIDDLPFDSAVTFNTCGAPAGYSVSGPDTSGCYTYTPDSNLVSGPVTTCQVIIKNGIADTTYITIEQATNQFPLPIHLTAFNVTQINCIAKVYWQTTTESDNGYFVVQRSMNGINWTDIGIVQSNHTGNNLNQYTFTDNKEINKICYYRLKSFDGSNHITYSTVKSVQCSPDLVTMQVYPNPTDGIVIIEIRNIPKNYPVQLVLRDITGQLLEVKKANSGSNNFMKADFNLSHLPAGNYPIEILYDQNKKVVIVQKR